MKKIMQSASVMGVLCLSLLSNGFANEHTNSKDRRGQRHPGNVPAEREITPPAGAKVSNGFDLFVTADFIYYNAVQNGVPFAATGVLPNNSNYIPEGSPFVNVPQGQVSSAASDWAPGFKVGLGMKTNHDNWSLYAEYTYLRARNTQVLTQAGSDATNSHGIVNPCFATYYGAGAATTVPYSIESIKGTWRLSHNKVNLDLARHFYVSPKLTMRPFVGGAGVWQTQELTSRATQNQIVFANGTVANPSFADDSIMQAYALGIRTGLDLGWHFTKCFSLQAAMSGDALWTNYYTQTLTSRMTNPATSAVSTLVNQANPDNYKVNYVAELGLALCYDWLSESQDYGFLIQVGWNAETWINWGHFLSGAADGGDFSMQGLDVKVRFDF